MAEKIDPEMLENLDMLLSMEEVEAEDEWEDIEKLEEAEAEVEDKDTEEVAP